MLEHKFTHDEGDPFSNVVLTEKFSRAPGTGSIDTVERKGGRKYLRARVWVLNDKGVRKRRSVYASSQTKLAKKVKELIASPTAPRNAKALDLGTFLTERYLPEAQRQVRPTTYDSYEIAVRVHIVPHLGKARLSTFVADNATAWLNDLDAGARARQNAFKVLKQAFNFAVDLGLIPANPLSRLKAPRAEPKETRIFGLFDLHRLLEAAEQTPWLALIYTAIATSARTSELFGLVWDDIDFERGFVHVQRQVVRTNDGLDFGKVKTKAANRRIDLPESLVKLLKQYKKSQPPNNLQLVFPAPNGGFMQKDNFSKRVWHPLLEQAKLPRATFYSLRHAGNSLLASEGYSPKLLMTKMGHSSPTVTLERYTMLGATEGRKGADLLGALLAKGTRSGDNRRGVA